MRCPNCQHSNSPSAKFCENCGFKLGSNTPAQATITPTPTPSADLSRLEKLVPKEFAQRLLQSRTGRVEGERRVVTILFCDVKGSTAMGEERDPEEILEIMNGAFDLLIEPVYRYEGTLARLMGDAILAFFGAPIAHEDDPERACLAALEIQANIARYALELKEKSRVENFAIRVGINTGLVVVGEVGSDLRVEYTAMGDAINLASRMEQSAEPGTIVISENTARHARYAIELEALGPLAIRGKSEPVHAYRVLSKKTVPESRRGIEGLSSPLIGRTNEMKLLEFCMQQLVEGQGQIVCILGEAGLGKSRLTAELSKSPSVASVRWFEGRSLSYETQTPYAPFVNLLAKILGLKETRDTASRVRELRERLHTLLGSQTEENFPFIATLMGLPLTGDDLERVRYLMPPFLRGRITQAIALLLGALAKEPTVLVFDDLHWADASSLELLNSLLPLSLEMPLMFVLLMRPNKTDPAWEFLTSAQVQYGNRTTVLELQPLDEQSSRELVANLLEIEDLPQSVRGLILQKAEGNPFYVEEVVRSLLDQKLVIREGNHWRATREIANIAIPDTLAGVITARLDRLDEESKRTAQTASILGREFEFAPLAELYESPDTLEPSLDTLTRRELVRRRDTSPSLTFLFKHALTQETAYNSLLLSKRRALHKRAASYLEVHEQDHVNDIARHWLDAQEEKRALPYILAAAEQAARAYASTEAISYYTRAKEIAHAVGDIQSLRRAYEGLGNALSFTPEPPKAVIVFQEMLEQGRIHDDVLMQVSALNKQANILSLRMGQMEQAESLLLQAETLARESQDRMGMGEMLVIRCQISVGSSDFDRAMEYMHDAVEIGKEVDAREQIAWGLDHLASTYAFMTKFDEAWQVSKEAWQAAQEINNREYQSGVLTTQALVHWRNGEFDTAIQTALEGSRIAETIGLTIMLVIGDWAAGWVHQQRGEYEAAIALFEHARRAAEPYESFMPFLSVMSLAGLGSTMLDLGLDPNTALAYHKRALDLSESPVGGMANGAAWADIAICAQNLGNTALAESLFSRALEHPSFFRLIIKPRSLIGLAEIALNRGDSDAAAAYIEQARDITETAEMLPFRPVVAFATGQLYASKNMHIQAVESYSIAEQQAQKLNMRPLMLHAQLSAAASLVALREYQKASEKRALAAATHLEIANLISDVELRTAYLKIKPVALPVSEEQCV